MHGKLHVDKMADHIEEALDEAAGRLYSTTSDKPKRTRRTLTLSIPRMSKRYRTSHVDSLAHALRAEGDLALNQFVILADEVHSFSYFARVAHGAVAELARASTDTRDTLAFPAHDAPFVVLVVFSKLKASVLALQHPRHFFQLTTAHVVRRSKNGARCSWHEEHTLGLLSGVDDTRPKSVDNSAVDVSVEGHCRHIPANKVREGLSLREFDGVYQRPEGFFFARLHYGTQNGSAFDVPDVRSLDTHGIPRRVDDPEHKVFQVADYCAHTHHDCHVLLTPARLILLRTLIVDVEIVLGLDVFPATLVHVVLVRDEELFVFLEMVLYTSVHELDELLSLLLGHIEVRIGIPRKSVLRHRAARSQGGKCQSSLCPLALPCTVVAVQVLSVPGKATQNVTGAFGTYNLRTQHSHVPTGKAAKTQLPAMAYNFTRDY
ncbi:hypothetical protein GQ600_25242 [Phytophthora cactorum]|nr:hypothetical protein GQ600_25242 [Phytophthora cactorum]